MSQPTPSKDPYQILSISHKASEQEIKSAYRKLAKTLHPDLNPGNKDSENRFKDVASAYELLGDPQKKAKYDQGQLEEGPFANHPFASGNSTTAGGPRPGAGSPFGDHQFYYQTQGGDEGSYTEGFSFEDLFGDSFKGRTKPGFAGKDQYYQMEIDLKDAARGAERDITLPNGKNLRVRIPPGVTHGAKLRFSGQGDSGIRGAPSGDAYVELRIRPSALFRQDGKNLELSLPISLAEAISGAEVRVPTLEGPVMLKIRPNASSGTRLRVRGKGLPDRAHPESKGDLIVILQIALPTHIDDEFRRAIVDWTQKHPYNPRADLETRAA